MKHFLFTSLSSATLLFSLASPQAIASNDHLSYDYIETSVATANTQLKQGGLEFDFKTRAAQLAGSVRLSEDLYISADINRNRTDDRDISRGIGLDINNSETNGSLRLGIIVPLAENIDFNAELGGRWMHQNNHLRVFPGNAVSSQKQRDQHLMWAIGLRSSWMNSFELETQYQKAGDFSQWRIGGPVYINEAFGVNLSYIEQKDNKAGRAYRAKAISLGLRYSF